MMSPEKTLTDRNGKTIHRGSVVCTDQGWLEVRSVYLGSKTVNLGPIFHSPKVTKKHVPLADVYEDHEAWYEQWSKSETYQSM
jgi:hypothetical protein